MELKEINELVKNKIYERVCYCTKCSKPFPSDRKIAVCFDCSGNRRENRMLMNAKQRSKK